MAEHVAPRQAVPLPPVDPTSTSTADANPGSAAIYTAAFAGTVALLIVIGCLVAIRATVRARRQRAAVIDTGDATAPEDDVSESAVFFAPVADHTDASRGRRRTVPKMWEVNFDESDGDDNDPAPHGSLDWDELTTGAQEEKIPLFVSVSDAARSLLAQSDVSTTSTRQPATADSSRPSSQRRLLPSSAHPTPTPSVASGMAPVGSLEDGLVGIAQMGEAVRVGVPILLPHERPGRPALAQAEAAHRAHGSGAPEGDEALQPMAIGVENVELVKF